MKRLTYFYKVLVIASLGLSLVSGCGKATGWARREASADDSAVAHFTSDQQADGSADTRFEQQPASRVETNFQFTSMTTPTVVGTAVSAVHTSSRSGLMTMSALDDINGLIQNASGVVIVDFYADWCGPCRRQGTILHELEPSASQNGALILKVNVDEQKAIARKFGVSSLPTLIVFKNGNIVKRQTGLTDRSSVERLLRM
ncbi:MAG: thioredoxin family protein [Planctomycetaceae bacterium]|nr:thioredoxin family protein [Planctomycetaceae bacterium]